MKPDELANLEMLLVRYFEGTLEQEQVETLDRVLRNDSSAQDYYFDYLKTHLALKQVRSVSTERMCERSDFERILEEMGQYEKNAAIMEIEKPKAAPVPIQKVECAGTGLHVSRLALYTVILSSAALVIMILMVKFAPLKQENTLAFLERTVDAQWENVSGRISEGGWLAAGPMKLVSGYVEMTMRGGASVIMQGPVEFTLETPNQIYLHNGRLTATLQKKEAGETFVVRSPYGSVVDYGTEFGVYVGSGGATETYVFNGKVQLRDSSDPMRFNDSIFISEGQGAVAELSGGILQISAARIDSNQFVRSEEMLLRHQAAEGSSYHRWQAYRYSIQRDPSLVACYRFEQDPLSPDRLINVAPATGAVLTGMLGEEERPQSAPTWTEGRWPQTGALQFDRAQKQCIRIPDHPRLRIAGSITMATWIKLPADDQPQGGLLFSNRTRDDINYQLTLGNRPSIDKMVLSFGRYGEFLDPKVHSQVMDLPGELWHHVVVTHDNRTVTYYVDGKLVSTIPYVFQQEPVAADLYIGFTPVAEASGFNGTVGELLLFDRALSEQEILHMYAQTRP